MMRSRELRKKSESEGEDKETQIISELFLTDREASFSDLPWDVVGEIVKYLSAKELLEFSVVTKKIKEKSNKYWFNLFKNKSQLQVMFDQEKNYKDLHYKVPMKTPAIGPMDEKSRALFDGFFANKDNVLWSVFDIKHCQMKVSFLSFNVETKSPNIFLEYTENNYYILQIYFEKNPVNKSYLIKAKYITKEKALKYNERYKSIVYSCHLSALPSTLIVQLLSEVTFNSTLKQKPITWCKDFLFKNSKEIAEKKKMKKWFSVETKRTCTIC